MSNTPLNLVDESKAEPKTGEKKPDAKASEPRIVAYDRDNFVALVNADESIDSRTTRKEIISAAGIDANTPSDYRVALYTDKSQAVLFKGKANPDGSITLEESKVISSTTEPSNRSLSNVVNVSSFTKLPKAIELPKPEKTADSANPSVEQQAFNLTAEQMKKLSADVTILALVDKMKGETYASASNAKLPSKQTAGNLAVA